nr:unnamed protein product [Callosobruchus chinensis]
MISAGVEGRLPYMTYPEPWRGPPKPPPELFLRPKPLPSTTRYMPRNYQCKTEKCAWDPEKLKKALNEIRNGSKIREVGRAFNIPESTLRKQMRAENPGEARLGRKAVFSPVIESQLKEYVLTLAKLFYGLTPKELSRLAFKYAEEHKIIHGFPSNKQAAGKDWLYGFLRRNPEIKLRQPEGTSINRIASFNSESTKKFFANLKVLMDRYHFPPQKIFNMDETGVTVVQKKYPKVYGPKGAKKVGAVISVERGRTITGVFAVSAAGNYCPPMLIYPRKRMSPALQRNGSIGALYACSKKGWINSELFVEWLKHFEKNVNPTETNPVLLILDNHSSHISLEAHRLCRSKFIHMVSLPPHTSDLQPLDLTFLLTNTAYEKILEYELAELLNKAFLKVATMEKSIFGLRTAGIYPLNPDRFTEDDFAAANQMRPLIIEAVPDKKLNPKATKRKCRDKQSSEILTSTPMKEQLEIADERRKISAAKKVNTAKRNVMLLDNEKGSSMKQNKSGKRKKQLSETSSESDVSNPVCDDEEDDFDIFDNSAPMEETSEVCGICKEFGRDRELYNGVNHSTGSGGAVSGGYPNGTRLAPPPARPISKYASPPSIATPVNLAQAKEEQVAATAAAIAADDRTIPDMSPYSPYRLFPHTAQFPHFPYPLCQQPYMLRTSFPPTPLSPMETFSPTAPTATSTFLSPPSTFSPPSVKLPTQPQTNTILRDKRTPPQQSQGRYSISRSPLAPPPAPSQSQAAAAFKVPSGKEGSLKHRILIRPEDNVRTGPLDLQKPPEGRKRLQATMSPPRSPKRTINNNTVSGNFTKGSLIQLHNGEFRRIEDMRTEDFVMSAERSPELRLAESTVVRIEEGQSGTATITLTYNQRRAQVEVESLASHPYFVMGAGWASCDPSATNLRYGLKVQRLQANTHLQQQHHPSVSTQSQPINLHFSSHAPTIAPPMSPESAAAAAARKRRWSAPDQICEEAELQIRRHRPSGATPE